MDWPPKMGEPLPRAAEAVGVRDKLVRYALDMAHERGGPKARGFERILGIAIGDVDYLEAEIRTGILVRPVHSIRDATPIGVSCVVELAVRGLGEKRHRVINVRTAWLLTDPDDPPRMTTAFPRP